MLGQTLFPAGNRASYFCSKRHLKSSQVEAGDRRKVEIKARNWLRVFINFILVGIVV